MRRKSVTSGLEAASTAEFEIQLLGELRVVRQGAEVLLPASRKTRALLAFLVATGRPHRRERLCELFWDLPNDPKAALRWSLTKLRKVVDSPDRVRIIADRERVALDAEGAHIDIHDAHARLRQGAEELSVTELEDLARRLDAVLLDGLDGAGDEAFDSWLAAVREDARAARVRVLRLLATHCQVSAVSATKWMRLWRDADPEGVAAFERPAAGPGASAAFGRPQTAAAGPRAAPSRAPVAFRRRKRARGRFAHNASVSARYRTVPRLPTRRSGRGPLF